jgi:hypothetical protein
MGRFRTVCRRLARVVLCFGALVVLALLAAQVEQHVFRRRAEQLAADLETLEMRKTTWQEAQARLAHWGASRKFSDSCDAQSCSVDITFTEFAFGFLSERNLFVRLDDYFRWRLRLSYNEGPFVRAERLLGHTFMRLGGRPATVNAHVLMQDSVVWNKAIWMQIENYSSHVPGWDTGNRRIDFGVVASAEAVSRVDRQRERWDPVQLARHPEYLIGKPSSCQICVATWTKFTPYADPSDVNRLMRMDSSCLTRWQPCVDHGEIMPEAWAQYLAERPQER